MARPHLAALAFLVALSTCLSACSSSEPTAEQPDLGSSIGPYVQQNTCTADSSSSVQVAPEQRLTDLSRTAGDLLLTNGIAPGPEVARNGELSSDQAADRASTVPGDASIAQALWVEYARPDAGLDVMNPNREYYIDQARKIAEFEVTEEKMGQWLGPNWASVVEVTESFARPGYEQYIDQVGEAPPMRAADGKAMRAQLRAQAVAAGLETQWETAQSIVGTYFWSCMMSSRDMGSEVDLNDSVLGEILAADAVGAAFARSFGSRDLIEPLAAGVQIVLDPTTAPEDGGQLTKNYDPNEILSPEDVELMEAEEPSLDGP